MNINVSTPTFLSRRGSTNGNDSCDILAQELLPKMVARTNHGTRCVGVWRSSEKCKRARDGSEFINVAQGFTRGNIAWARTCFLCSNTILGDLVSLAGCQATCCPAARSIAILKSELSPRADFLSHVPIPRAKMTLALDRWPGPQKTAYLDCHSQTAYLVVVSVTHGTCMLRTPTRLQ